MKNNQKFFAILLSFCCLLSACREENPEIPVAQDIQQSSETKKETAENSGTEKTEPDKTVEYEDVQDNIEAVVPEVYTTVFEIAGKKQAVSFEYKKDYNYFINYWNMTLEVDVDGDNIADVWMAYDDSFKIANGGIYSEYGEPHELNGDYPGGIVYEDNFEFVSNVEIMGTTGELKYAPIPDRYIFSKCFYDGKLGICMDVSAEMFEKNKDALLELISSANIVEIADNIETTEISHENFQENYGVVFEDDGKTEVVTVKYYDDFMYRRPRPACLGAAPYRKYISVDIDCDGIDDIWVENDDTYGGAISASVFFEGYINEKKDTLHDVTEVRIGNCSGMIQYSASLERYILASYIGGNTAVFMNISGTSWELYEEQIIELIESVKIICEEKDEEYDDESNYSVRELSYRYYDEIFDEYGSLMSVKQFPFFRYVTHTNGFDWGVDIFCDFDIYVDISVTGYRYFVEHENNSIYYDDDTVLEKVYQVKKGDYSEYIVYIPENRKYFINMPVSSDVLLQMSVSEEVWDIYADVIIDIVESISIEP